MTHLRIKKKLIYIIHKLFFKFLFKFNSLISTIPTHTYRLDRKSSRGMIYENEELRLRTININAEVERGKYDKYDAYFLDKNQLAINEMFSTLISNVQK